MELKINLSKKIQDHAEKSGGIRKHYPGVWQFFDNELEMMYNNILKDVMNLFGDEILSMHYLEQECCEDSIKLLKSKIEEHFRGE